MFRDHVLEIITCRSKVNEDDMHELICEGESKTANTDAI